MEKASPPHNADGTPKTGDVVHPEIAGWKGKPRSATPSPAVGGQEARPATAAGNAEPAASFEQRRYERQINNAAMKLSRQPVFIHYMNPDGSMGSFPVNMVEARHTPVKDLFTQRDLKMPGRIDVITGMTEQRSEPLPQSAWEESLAHHFARKGMAPAAEGLAAAAAAEGFAARVGRNLSHMSGVDKSWAAAMGVMAAMSLYSSVRAFSNATAEDPATGKPRIQWNQTMYGAFEAAFGALMAHTALSRVVARGA